MDVLCVIFASLGVLLGTAGGEDCGGVPQGGVVSWGCRAYTKCDGGRLVTVDCHRMGQVYHPDRSRCDSKLNTPAPCGLHRDCRVKRDGRYADQETGCTAFYTCRAGRFYGHNKCTPGLAFNEPSQVCDWAFNVAPPCGTKGGVARKATPSRPDVNVRNRKLKRRRQFRNNRKTARKTQRTSQTKARRTQSKAIFRDVVHGF